ncbi:GDP-L-fucose synthase [Mangrovibacterium marinum]|uniref:GDP-L-fucose synthase family protein n=1 Tax=Mangrovibacterium marinum TaxID=1639118 RepID=UPI002A187915|nr:GDP-L-fucose synthase [Mangrovibacterium marinum]
MEKNSKIYIAGHRGLVGSAILKNLQECGYTNFVTRTHRELDLTNQQAVADFFATEKPDYVFLAAAKVGGIVANNTYRGQFIYENLMIQNNVIHAAWKNEVKKLMFLGSTCIYPREAPQPMPENCLLTSPLEYTNEPYAMAKIAGIKLCESYNLQYGTNYISVMPTNLYGPNDNFDLEKSHVLPAMIRKIHLGKCLQENNWDAIRKDLDLRPIEGIDGKAGEEAILTILAKYGICQSIPQSFNPSTSVELWGTGKPMREFLWSEEMADACVYLMEKINFKDLIGENQDLNLSSFVDKKEIRNTHINIGTGKEISIRELAELIRATVGYQGQLAFNTDKPDGTMRKLTDVSKLHELGWQHRIEIAEGVQRMYDWYLASSAAPRLSASGNEG